MKPSAVGLSHSGIDAVLPPPLAGGWGGGLLTNRYRGKASFPHPTHSSALERVDLPPQAGEVKKSLSSPTPLERPQRLAAGEPALGVVVSRPFNKRAIELDAGLARGARGLEGCDQARGAAKLFLIR